MNDDWSFEEHVADIESVEAIARAEAAEAEAALYWIEIERLDVELATAEAEVARLTTDISTTICERDDAMAYVDMIRTALGGYGDSNLASLAETLRKRNDALEVEVERLREALAEIASGGCVDPARLSAEAIGR
jgi:chromosome segregation ATPase